MVSGLAKFRRIGIFDVADHAERRVQRGALHGKLASEKVMTRFRGLPPYSPLATYMSVPHVRRTGLTSTVASPARLNRTKSAHADAAADVDGHFACLRADQLALVHLGQPNDVGLLHEQQEVAAQPDC